jgi:hypothetical protein
MQRGVAAGLQRLAACPDIESIETGYLNNGNRDLKSKCKIGGVPQALMRQLLTRQSSHWVGRS